MSRYTEPVLPCTPRSSLVPLSHVENKPHSHVQKVYCMFVCAQVSITLGSVQPLADGSAALTQERDPCPRYPVSLPHILQKPDLHGKFW